MPDPRYSIVIPVYNEEDSLKELFAEIMKAMTKCQPYEIIFVDDCSSDRSREILENFKKEFFEIVRVVRLSRRTGQTLALRQGLEMAKGEVVVTLDADLQNDPADIPKLFETMKEGYDCVCGWRKARQDTPLKAGLSKFGNVLQRLLTGLKIHDVSCTLRVYQRKALSKIALEWEGQHRFIPLMLSLKGCLVGEIISHHRQRKYGYTKYSHKRIGRVIVDFFRILKESRKKV